SIVRAKHRSWAVPSPPWMPWSRPWRLSRRHGSGRAPARLRSAFLLPTVEDRYIARVPALAQARSVEIPVWADLAREVAQVVPQVDHRRPAPEPVAHVDLVDHEAG